MVNNSDLIKQWKESKTSLTFLEWKNSLDSPDTPKTIEPITQYPTKRPIRYATSGATGEMVRVKNWDEFSVQRHVYLKKRHYDRLLTNTSVSKQINKILEKYFEWEDKTKFTGDTIENERREEE